MTGPPEEWPPTSPLGRRNEPGIAGPGPGDGAHGSRERLRNLPPNESLSAFVLIDDVGARETWQWPIGRSSSSSRVSAEPR